MAKKEALKFFIYDDEKLITKEIVNVLKAQKQVVQLVNDRRWDNIVPYLYRRLGNYSAVTLGKKLPVKAAQIPHYIDDWHKEGESPLVRVLAHFGLEPTRYQSLLIANEQGGTAAMHEIGAVREECEKIIEYLMLNDGISEAAFEEALADIAKAKKRNGIYFITLDSAKMSRLAYDFWFWKQKKNSASSGIFITFREGKLSPIYMGDKSFAEELHDNFGGVLSGNRWCLSKAPVDSIVEFVKSKG